MATSIAAQLEAIKYVIQADTKLSGSSKRSFTCHSILFDAKEATDIDVHTIDQRTTTTTISRSTTITITDLLLQRLSTFTPHPLRLRMSGSPSTTI
ncbi:hypothetical protein ACFX2G_032303 [Malus domestica]